MTQAVGLPTSEPGAIAAMSPISSLFASVSHWYFVVSRIASAAGRPVMRLNSPSKYGLSKVAIFL